MRTQAERDEQTLEIASFVLCGAVLLVGLGIVVAAFDAGGTALFWVAVVGCVAASAGGSAE
jgi:hypothetical protein